MVRAFAPSTKLIRKELRIPENRTESISRKRASKKREDIKPNHLPPVSPSWHPALLLLGWGHRRTLRVLNRGGEWDKILRELEAFAKSSRK